MKHVQQILVAVDSSVMAEESLKRAISIAKEKAAQLMVMHVIEPPFTESPLFKSIDPEKVRAEIAEQIDRLNAQANVDYLLFVESAKAADAIILKARKTRADLLVIGSHGKDDIESRHFGSTSLKLVQRTHIPVLIVKQRRDGLYSSIIAPTNLSDYSKESILFARSIFSKASCRYLYAFESISKPQARTYYINDDQLEAWRLKMASKAVTEMEEFVRKTGDGEKAMIEFSASLNEDLLDYIEQERADLLVLGSKGVDNLNSFVFGSTASYLLRRSPIDVLVYVPC